MSEPATTVAIDGHRLTLTHLDKVLYPSGFVKAEVIDYYRRIAPLMLPHLHDRPITLKRYPNGSQGPFFYQKRSPPNAPSWLRTAHIATKHEPIDFCLIDDVAGLVWLANLACLEIHTYLYRATAPQVPTMLVLDLDPGAPATIIDCCTIALELRRLLAAQGLEALIKVSGSKGLHLMVPLNSPTTFEHSKHIAHALAATMERLLPDLVTSTMAKSERIGKVFIDWSQNDASKTTCCVYSLRAQAQPTVSAPVGWELITRCAQRRDPAPLVVTAADLLARKDFSSDPLAELETRRQRLPAAVSPSAPAPEPGPAPASRPARAARKTARATQAARPRTTAPTATTAAARAARPRSGRAAPRPPAQERGRTKLTGLRRK